MAVEKNLEHELKLNKKLKRYVYPPLFIKNLAGVFFTEMQKFLKQCSYEWIVR